MAWFAAMPRDQQLYSLSPDFARADLARASGHDCVHVGYEEGASRWLHSAHLRQLQGWGQAAISPYGYGGPVCNDEDAGFVRRAYAAWSGWARDHNVLGEFCRFHPQAGHHRFWLGDVRPNRATISLDLDVEPVETQYNALARRKLRRSQQVPVRWSRAREDWQRYGHFYREAMVAMGAQDRYCFDDGYFAALAALVGSAICICGNGDDWLSAGIYLFQQSPALGGGRGGTIEYHLGASSAAGYAAATPYRMQHAAAGEGRRRGLSSLYMGGGTTAEPDNPLLFHKRAFSRRELIFYVGNAVHHHTLYRRYVEARGYHPGNAPTDLLFD